MGRPSKLTAEAWAAARRRWEGAQDPGFEWLRRELLAAFGDAPGRPALSQAAREGGWTKTGVPSEPIAPPARGGRADAGASDTAARASVTASITPATRAKVTPKVSGVSNAAATPRVRAQDVGSVPMPSTRRVSVAMAPASGETPVYRPEFDQMILDHFDKEPFTDYEVPQGNGLTRLQRMPTPPPMLSDFANSIGVSVSTVNGWATLLDAEGRFVNPSFAAAYARAREMNESMFVTGAALGAYDGRVVTFVLKNLYGWQDQPQKAAEVVMPSRSELEERYIKVMEAARAKRAAVIAERAHLWAGDDV